MVGADGGVFAFGDAVFVGSLPGRGITPMCPFVEFVPVQGSGYGLVTCDGEVFAFGSPYYVGSLTRVLPPGKVLASPVTGMVPFGDGHLMVTEAGEVLNLATNRASFGSLGVYDLPDTPIVGIAPVDIT